MAEPAQNTPLERLYTQRAIVVTAGRVAEAAVLRGDPGARVEAERLFAELNRIDQAINRLEAGNDTKH